MIDLQSVRAELKQIKACPVLRENVSNTGFQSLRRKPAMVEFTRKSLAPLLYSFVRVNWTEMWRNLRPIELFNLSLINYSKLGNKKYKEKFRKQRTAL